MSVQRTGVWIVERDGNGYPAESAVRYQVAPADGVASRAFVAALLDLGARIGLESRALPDELFTAAGSGAVLLRSEADALALLDEPEGEAWDAAPVDTPPRNCLARLFS